MSHDVHQHHMPDPTDVPDGLIVNQDLHMGHDHGDHGSMGHMGHMMSMAVSFLY